MYLEVGESAGKRSGDENASDRADLRLRSASMEGKSRALCGESGGGNVDRIGSG